MADDSDIDSWYVRNRIFIRTLSVAGTVLGIVASVLGIWDYVTRTQLPTGGAPSQAGQVSFLEPGKNDPAGTSAPVSSPPANSGGTLTASPGNSGSSISEIVRPSPVRSPPPSAPTSWTIASVISVEHLAADEETQLPFPTPFFLNRLKQELGETSTSLHEIRVAVTFIEPHETRRFADGGTVIGYLLVSLPGIPGCVRHFGGQAYSFPDAATAIMKAVNDQVPDIAHWITTASQGETLTCPS